MKLVLAEKPSVGKELARVIGASHKKNGYYEGNGYVVTWALGHLVTLADPDVYDKKYANWHLEDLPILPKYLKTVVIGNSRKQFNTIKGLFSKDIKEVIIATDAGREGELVARWILSKLQVKQPLKRLWISSVTDKAIKDGFRNLKPGKAYDNLYKAAIARAEGDWLVGINATRALTTKFNTSLSCGRVQTPTLAMIAEREDKIRLFKPRKFYGISLQTVEMTLTWHKNNQTQEFNEDKIDKIIAACKQQPIKVQAVERKQKKKYPSALYDLTELQRDVFNKYKYSPKKTLSIMQKLYEHHKALTYPRTDSRYLTSDMVATLKERLQAVSLPAFRKEAFRLSKQPIKAQKHFVNDKLVTDHHAIIPTEVAINPQDLSFEERQVYEMVTKRFLEVLMPAYTYEETKVQVQVAGESFKTSFSKTLDIGYKALSEDRVKDTGVTVNKGDSLNLKQYLKTSGETNPPAYFNEGSLLSAMEKPGAFVDDNKLKAILDITGGLGTVATRADIIEKLYNTEVISNSNHQIRITNKGRQLLRVAPKDLKSPALTAEWEQKLKDIELGKLNYKSFVGEMKSYTEQVIGDIKKSDVTFKHDNISSTKCPECGKLMMRKKTKHGESLVCQDRACNHRISVSRVTNARCPECHKKLTMVGQGDKKMFVCKCGYREKLSAFEKRKKETGKKGGKRDYQQYLKKQEQEAKANKKSAFSALAGLNLKDD